jgi:transcriptional regulator with XRE-family HTH domain
MTGYHTRWARPQDIERIEEGGTEPTIPLLRRLAAALNAGARLTGGHDLGSVWFETHAA